MPGSNALYLNSDNTIRFRLYDEAGAAIASGVVLVTLSRLGVVLFAARTAAYDAAKYLYPGYTTVGCYVCQLQETEIIQDGPVVAQVDVTASGLTLRTILTLLARVDNGL